MTLCLALAWLSAAAQEGDGLSATLSGGQFTYTVQAGDSLTAIGARFGVDAVVLARANDLRYDALLQPDQMLRVDNRHIVPLGPQDGILINLPQRMLFFFQAGELAAAFPVGLGRPDWPTPTGTFEIVVKEEDPVWDVPVSIQEEMRRAGKTVVTRVPPGPDNPLGRYWLGLSIPGYGIHATIAPSSIYQFRSHGCIRVHTDDIAALFARVEEGEPGEIIYAPVLLAKLADGRIFLEVHRDVYRKGGNPLKRVQELAVAAQAEGLIDWGRVAQLMQQKEGLAREITFPAPDTEESIHE